MLNLKFCTLDFEVQVHLISDVNKDCIWMECSLSKHDGRISFEAQLIILLLLMYQWGQLFGKFNYGCSNVNILKNYFQSLFIEFHFSFPFHGLTSKTQPYF